MKPASILVTGGAGFIGSHLVDRLVALGNDVRVLDSLEPRVHGQAQPSYLNPKASYLWRDVRDRAAVDEALEGVDKVVHFAAAVGVGQSMYEIADYCSHNVMGAATLLEAIARRTRRPERILVASSMSIYGEGLYQCDKCGPMAPRLRPEEQLRGRDWSMHCPECGAPTKPLPTPETKPIVPTSIYAINKRDHEEMVLVVARSLGIAAIALRFFNVYGSRQSLSNPYTGVAAIFSSALLSGQPPKVFEDGGQVRDFIHVSDIVNACVLALEQEHVRDEVFNVGTGAPTDLLQLLELIRGRLPGSKAIQAQVLGRYRAGDIRACYADIRKARTILGYSPQVALQQGVVEMAAWLGSQKGDDRSDGALGELEKHSLVR